MQRQLRERRDVFPDSRAKREHHLCDRGDVSRQVYWLVLGELFWRDLRSHVCRSDNVDANGRQRELSLMAP